jgi:hypothetical protein
MAYTISQLNCYLHFGYSAVFLSRTFYRLTPEERGIAEGGFETEVVFLRVDYARLVSPTKQIPWVIKSLSRNLQY